MFCFIDFDSCGVDVPCAWGVCTPQNLFCLAKIISIHSFRGGTGKSNTTANLAALLAADGQRVGVIDTDIQSPGIHVLFGVKGAAINHSLNDYLRWHCAISQAAHDVTATLGARPTNQGNSF